MSDIQVNWQFWLETQTSLSGSPKHVCTEPWDHLWGYSRGPGEGLGTMTIPVLRHIGKHPPCLFLQQVGFLHTWHILTNSYSPVRLSRILLPLSRPTVPHHQSTLGLWLPAATIHQHVLSKGVAGQLDKQPHLTGRVPISRMTSIISWLLWGWRTLLETGPTDQDMFGRSKPVRNGHWRILFYFSVCLLRKQLESKAENLCLLRHDTLRGDKLLKISLVEDIIRKGQEWPIICL